MINFAKRISALEQTSPCSIEPIFVQFVGLDTKDSEIQRITKGNHEWPRKSGESEQDLKDRAIGEVPPPKAGCSSVFLCY